MLVIARFTEWYKQPWVSRQLSASSQSLSLPVECMFLSVSRVKFVSLTVHLETAFRRLDRLVIHALTALSFICSWPAGYANDQRAENHNPSTVMASMSMSLCLEQATLSVAEEVTQFKPNRV